MNATDDRPVADLRDAAVAPEPPTSRGALTRPYTAGPDPRRKSPALASILSIVPGLGQVYVGYYQRGFIHAIAAFSIIAVLSWEPGGDAIAPLLGPFLMFFWLYNIIDAGRRATLLNHALAGMESVDLPSDFRAPGFGGSVAGGIALIAFGALALAHLRFGMPLDWIATWWPVAPIAFGGWLVVKALREHGTARV